MTPAATREAECCYEPVSPVKDGYGIREWETFEGKCSMACRRISLTVSKKLFDGVQFIFDKESEKYGSAWQRMVCDELWGLEGREEEFWYRRKHGGMNVSREAIKRRRNCVTRAMEKKFHGK